MEIYEETPSETGANEESPIESQEEFRFDLIDKLKKARREDDAINQDELCIYRIPGYLRDKDESDYPQTISLGPYHYGRAHLQPMDRHKLRAVNTLLKRTKHDIRMYLDAVEELEEKARACYEGPIAMKKKDFIKMLTVDGCFVLEYIRGAHKGYVELGYAKIC